jgi:SpoIID/LytB domain protein
LIVSVGLIEGLEAVEVELMGGAFVDDRGQSYGPGRYRYTAETTLAPADFAACAFILDNVTIGLGFHWQRRERQAFRGSLRLSRGDKGLSVINDVPLDEYVTSVISSEMSAFCPLELLKAHAVISRSWLWFPKANRRQAEAIERESLELNEIRRWYGRESHQLFDVCADDHCQRYQGITKVISAAAAEAAHSTTRQFLRYNGVTCDARYAKCCGGLTERYATAWEETEIPYLESVYDGLGQAPAWDIEEWIHSRPPAYCNTQDSELLARLLPGFDQETRDFFRWRVSYTSEELADLFKSRVGIDLGEIRDLEALARGPSGRIHRLRIVGERGDFILGKELEIRRALSRSHLYSSAFVVDKEADRFVLSGAGWGHGVGMCQIGAAVMANNGSTYEEILRHYYPGTTVGV